MAMEWTAYVAGYLFLGGLAAGTYLTSAIADIGGKGKYDASSKFGAHVTWPILMLGMLLLVIDLGRPGLTNLDHILNVFNKPDSMITLGTYFISGLVIIGLVSSFLWRANWKRTRVRFAIEIIGSFFAVAVAVYTGLLLALAWGHPFWSSPFLPWLFTVSAISTGMVFVGLANSTLGSKLFPLYQIQPQIEILDKVDRIDTYLMTAELIILGAYLGEISLTGMGITGVEHLVAGVLSPVFWGLVVVTGLLVPLLIGTVGISYLKKNGHAKLIPSMMTLSFILVLIGGFFLRYAIVLAAQI